MLSKEQIDEYYKNGVLVIENVLTEEEVNIARQGLHQQLLTFGIDHDKVLNGEQILKEDGRIKGSPSKIFYGKWKIDIQLHDKVYAYSKALMEETYFKNSAPCPFQGRLNEASADVQPFNHPFGKANDILPYIDRICWRLPDHIRPEGGLSMHLDRNPFDPYLYKSDGIKKWKPIQAFISLTDQFGSTSGGLRVVKGFHRRIDEYFSKTEPHSSGVAKQHSKLGITKSFKETLSEPEYSGGEFYRMNSKTHAPLQKQLEPINAPKGSLVLWDNRLPHATTDLYENFDSREVVYIGWLPNIDLNQKYWIEQSNAIKKNIPPPAYSDREKNSKNEKADRDWELNDLTPKQKLMLGL